MFKIFWMFVVLCGLLSASFALADEDLEPAQEKYLQYDDLFSLYQTHADNFSAYQPIYGLIGTNPEKSSFQISFKYRPLNPQGSWVQARPWLQRVFLAYTQTTFYDLKEASTPFEDTSYKPEIFFITENLDSRPQSMQGFFIKTGLQHESNGRGGDMSRSTNFLYVRPMTIFYSEDSGLGLMLAARAWTYVNNSRDHNPDLHRYRGYFELETKLGKDDFIVVGAKLRWASQGASVQVDATYPLHRLVSGNLDLFFHVQYVNALAENLLDYQSRTESLRLGLALVR
ncbi:Outer membrane phospholipase A [Geoalkalibacter ferrihydriticus]|uniref:Phosphatidylcholine 1-acylhydrolase n=2 Tax=Geoalkalibacter ferrihydriticus TaxID=392333 RepID=A0A0C2EHC8_9BACT|nr:phospholipase A [Geoalkalibacter ferrihydriticus]KIH78078.1 hypothetical protein GFER_05700 [Geoalkalibacter ferrihydriticus DSM 17813]SDM30339.1 Outer membrane phospholipase A [Geoalkalibacter ferrihydriticus]